MRPIIHAGTYRDGALPPFLQSLCPRFRAVQQASETGKGLLRIFAIVRLIEKRDECLDNLRIELRACTSTQFGTSLVIRVRALVTAFRDHRIIRVSDRDDPREKRNCVSCQPIPKVI